MPLPASTLSLVGLPLPGDSMYQKPKYAMIVRMSSETFEALDNPQNDRRLEVEFGENPGLYIGGQFFPVQHSAESQLGNHELYLRLPSANKPMAPLKLYANVIGKFMVERELGEKVQETVRDRTLEAEKARTERKAIYLDKPPDLRYPGVKGKKKDAPAARRAPPSSNLAISSKPSATASQKVSPLPVPASSSKVSSVASSNHASNSSKASALPNAAKASPLPSSTTHTNSSTDISSTRGRLIHCLALRPRTMDAVIAMCAGREPTSRMKNELISLLQSVAAPVPVAKNSDPEAPQRWQLKLDSWREVRPYEWPSLTEGERTHLARQARKAYQDLRIPQSDPIWDIGRYRSADEPASGPPNKTAAGSRAPAEKNGVVMTKTKKTKIAEGTRKKVSDIVIPAKDESGKGKVRDLDESSAAGTPTSATRPAVRRQPGSGYKVKHSATPPVAEMRANSPLPPVPKKTGAADTREMQRSSAASSVPAKSLPPPPPPAQESRSNSATAAAAQNRKKAKVLQASSGSRAAEDRREDRIREREQEEEKPRVKVSASPVPPPLPSFKRKKPPQDDNDSEYSEREIPLSASGSKKRKLDKSLPSSVEKVRGRDLSLPQKPVVREPSPLAPMRTKIKEASPFSAAFSPPRSSSVRSSLPPLPPPAEKSSSSAKGNRPVERSSGKSRRKSPKYTSSEDESERSVPAVRPRAAVQAHSPSEEPPAKRFKSTHTPRFKPRPLPTDTAGLRKYYHYCYRIYNELYKDHSQRRTRIERLLRKAEEERPDVSDEDVDVDELSPEVLKPFMDDLNAVMKELQKVRQTFDRLENKRDALGELVDVC